MRILVVGGAGYVGSTSVETFVAAGHAVTVYDNLSTGHREAVLPAARLLIGDIHDTPLLERVLREERIEAVLHCAARSLVGESMSDPALYYHANVAGGVSLLDAMKRAGVDRLVYSSTSPDWRRSTARCCRMFASRRMPTCCMRRASPNPGCRCCTTSTARRTCPNGN